MADEPVAAGGPSGGAGLCESGRLVREACEAMARGEYGSLLDRVDAQLEWTFLDPSEESPEPQVCRGRAQLARQIASGRLRALGSVEEITAYGERVVVVTHSPGLDERRARKTGDRRFHVVMVRDGCLSAIRACRSRDEAVRLAAGPGPV